MTTQILIIVISIGYYGLSLNPSILYAHQSVNYKCKMLTKEKAISKFLFEIGILNTTKLIGRRYLKMDDICQFGASHYFFVHVFLIKSVKVWIFLLLHVRTLIFVRIIGCRIIFNGLAMRSNK